MVPLVFELRAEPIAYQERSGDLGAVLRPKRPRIIDIAVADGVQTVRLVWDHGGDE